MAGRPKTRAKKAEKQLQELEHARKREEILRDFPVREPAEPVPRAIPAPDDAIPPASMRHPRTSSTPTRARVRAGMGPGSTTRTTVDAMSSHEITKLSRALKPGLLLVIERLKPAWCAGWVEDYEVQDGDISELRAHIADEHGGAQYRVIVTDASGTPYFETPLKIAGQPRQNGRIIDRDLWEGKTVPAVQQPTAATNQGESASLLTAMASIFKNILDVNQSSNDRTMKAVENMSRTTSEQTERLISTIVQSRENAQAQTSFVGTLNELVKANEAMKTVRDALLADVPTDEKTEESLINKAMEGAATQFLTSVMQRKMGVTAGNHSQKNVVDLPSAITDPAGNVRRKA